VPRTAAVHGLLIARATIRIAVGRLVDGGGPGGRRMTYGCVSYGADLIGGGD
jgi:hypothetical protein